MADEDTSSKQSSYDSTGTCFAANPGKFLVDEYRKILRKVQDTSPLPRNFPRQQLFELYVCRTILFAAFTIGIRLGNLSILYVPISIFGNTFTVTFTYVVIPIAGLQIIVSYQRGMITMHEMRVLVITWAVLAGMFSEACNINYVLGDSGQPTYFMPFLIGITIQAIGPQYDKDRKMLVGLSVGSAVVAALTLHAIFDQITFATILGLTVSCLNATIALQLCLYDIIHGKVDIELTHVFGIIIAMINHLLVCRITGRYVDDPSANDISRAMPLRDALHI
ncbi:unnamed protein product [Caenorhabditis auriculariae]|uniref:Uncharacterized protein n=1 Tax=Caenorhabditis auriculariae TaxID=2777116 RepID=A0A8S1H835_9PELO|nr:unnamed protein product [Caenorhabditis auriculariae]